MDLSFIKRHEISYKKHLEIVSYKKSGKNYQEIAVFGDCSKNAAFAVP